MADKVPEWKKQEELRAQRKSRKKGTRMAQDARSPRSPLPATTKTLRLVLVDESTECRRAAYKALKQELVGVYFPKYKYHPARQEAAMKGELVLRSIPFPLFVQMQSALTGKGKGWKMGKIEGLAF